VTPTAEELDRLRYEFEITNEILHPSPFFVSALAYDRALAESPEHPLMRYLRRPPATEGGTSMPYDNYRPARDQRNGLDPRGGNSRINLDQGEEGELPDPQTCCAFVEMMLNGHAANDDQNETTGHNELMMLLANLLAQHHDNGNGEDQSLSGMPNAGSPSGFNGRGGFDGTWRAPRSGRRTGNDRARGVARRANDRRPALDSNVLELNRQSFARRFPEMAKIWVMG
jgi:hypothetical protein